MSQLAPTVGLESTPAPTLLTKSPPAAVPAELREPALRIKAEPAPFAVSEAPEFITMLPCAALAVIVLAAVIAPANEMASPAPVAARLTLLAVIAPTLRLPAAVTARFRPMVEAPSVRAAPLVTDTSLAPLLLSETAPKKSLAWPSVIGLAPVVKEAVPGTVAAPDCVMAPPAVTARLPPLVSVSAGRPIAALLKVSVRLRRLPSPAKLGRAAAAFVLRRLTSLMFEAVPPNTGAVAPKLLAWVPRRMSEPAAVTERVVVPPLAVIAPVSVMLPPAITERLAPMAEVPRARAAPLVTATSFAPELLSATAPVKPLAWVSVIACAPAVKEAVPAPAACVIPPVWVISPVADVTVRVPAPTLEVPRIVAPPLVSETLPAPLLFSETAPVKAFAWVSAIALAPALNVATPAPAACVVAPVCVIAPVEFTLKVPVPTDEAPSAGPTELVSDTAFAPLLFSATAPVKSLAWVRVIALAPALNVATPAAAA